jgi:hypothetical protein
LRVNWDRLPGGGVVLVFSRDTKDAVGIQVKTDFNLRDNSWSWRNAF